MSRKLRAAYDFIRTRMAEEGLAGLDVSHGDILYRLLSGGPLAMTELAAGIDRDKSTVTTLVQKMERMGLVRREKDPADGRLAVVTLTEKGSGYEAAFYKISEELLSAMYAGFSETDKRVFAELLGRLGEP